jgi:nitroreductase
LTASGEGEERIARAATKYLRAPTVVIVGTAPGDSILRSAENRDAVAAGIQNLLLAATALGLASYWTSCVLEAHPAIAEFCGFEPTTHITGIIHLGWPERATTGERKAARAGSVAVHIL